MRCAGRCGLAFVLAVHGAAFHEAQRLMLASAIEKYRQHLAPPPDGAVATAVGLACARGHAAYPGTLLDH
jgi:hypothetical protein